MQKELEVPAHVVEESKGEKIPEVKGKEIDIPSSGETIVSSEKKCLIELRTISQSLSRKI